MKNIVIIGSGGFAKEVAFLIEEINKVSSDDLRYNILGYVDKEEKVDSRFGKYPVFMDDDNLLRYEEKLNVALGIGSPNLSKSILGKLIRNTNLLFPTLIHPNSVGDWDRIKFGMGNVVCANTVFTTDIEVGDFNIFNLSCTIGHDVTIGSYNVFNPSVNVSGGVEIVDRNLIGTGAQLLQYISLKKDIIVGAGAVVTKSIDDSGTYAGVPAKRLG